VAIKRVKCKICDGRCICGDDKFQQKERDTLVHLAHSNLVQFLYCGIIDTIWYFVMEKCDCNLDDQFKNVRDHVSTCECVGYMLGVAEGLYYMHGKNTTHRDLKPANILVLRNKAKIADFGLCRTVTEKRSESDVLSKVTRDVGTCDWQAPEISSDDYSFPVDIFSLALIFLAMICHKVGKGLEAHKGE
jgi:serine/threonine protein kinase